MAREPQITIEKRDQLSDGMLESLMHATREAIVDGGGIGWIDIPSEKDLREYWRGRLCNHLTTVIIAINTKDDGVLGSVQLVEHHPVHAAAARHRAEVARFFVRPSARGCGVGSLLLERLIEEARSKKLELLQLDVRVTQTAAIALYQQMGFKQWGRNPDYARVDGEHYGGLYMSLKL